MILMTGFTSLKSILILAFLLLVPNCVILYPWVLCQQTLYAFLASYLYDTCLTLLFFWINSSLPGKFPMLMN